MATTTKLMTAEELLEMPDDGFRYELVRGELVKMPPAGHMSSFREMLIGSHLRRICPKRTVLAGRIQRVRRLQA